MRKSLLAIAAALSLAGCGTTETLLAGAGVAGGLLSSLTSSPDYTKYADTCKDIIASARDAANGENMVLVEVAKDKTMNNSLLLYMAMRPKTNAFQQCALAMPKGFLDRLAESGNLLNFVATVYGVNRDSINQRKRIEISKELGLAEMQQRVELQELENALLGRLANGTINGVNAGAAAARP
jgi:hypothetical protein